MQAKTLSKILARQTQEHMKKSYSMTKFISFQNCEIYNCEIYTQVSKYKTAHKLKKSSDDVNKFRIGLLKSSVSLHDKSPEETRNRRNISQYNKEHI